MDTAATPPIALAPGVPANSRVAVSPPPSHRDGVSLWATLLLCGVVACSSPAPSQSSGGGGFELSEIIGGQETQIGGDTGAGADAAVNPDGQPSDAADGTEDVEDGVSGEDGEATAEDSKPGGITCTKTSACKDLAGTPYCDVSTQTCVACLIDFHCKDSTGHCQDNKCTEVSCVPGSSSCKGSNGLEICNADGKTTEVKACPDALPVCSGGKCRFCLPGVEYCEQPEPGVQQPTVAMKCNDQGTDSDILQICQTGQICHDGKCSICLPQEKKCLGNKAVVCRDDGTAFDLFKDCDSVGQTCLVGVCVDPCAGDFKANTNVGCDYFAVDLDNAVVPAAGGKVYDAQNSQFSVIVSNTTASPALVAVSTLDGKSAKYAVQANALKIINLPDPLWKMAPLNQDGTNINDKSYRIQSTVPIVAYQFNPLQNVDVFSNDASLLLPSNAVGTEYWVMTRQQTHANLRGTVTIVAVSQGTTKVDVLVTTKTLGNMSGAQPIPPGPWTGFKTFLLTRGQVINIETDQNGADLTGSYIKADHPVAVFGGSESSNAPDTNKCVKPPGAAKGNCQYQGWDCLANDDCPVTCCADHLEEQLFPVTAWGKTYIASKLQPRGKEKDVWRVLAAVNGTVVQTNPEQAKIPTLNQGQWFEFESDQDFVILANHPIQVGHFMVSSHAPNPNNDLCTTNYGSTKLCTTSNAQYNSKIPCTKHSQCPNILEAADAKIGDPDFLLTLAADQYLDDYVFLVPNKYKENFINVIAPLDALAVTVDDLPVQQNLWKAIPGVPWRVARVPIAQGAHRLKSPGRPVGLYVYGWDDYVIYSFPGGAKIKKAEE